MRAALVRKVVFATVLFMALVYLITRPTPSPPGRGIQPDDPDLACDPAYFACFTPSASINKTFPDPFYLKNLAENNAPGASRTALSGAALHVPGDIFKAGPDSLATCCQGGNFGLTRARVVTDAGDPGSLFYVQNCNPTTRFEWRPDKLVGICTDTGNGRRLEMEFRPLGDNTFLFKIFSTCIPANSTSCGFNLVTGQADNQTLIAGYTALRIALNESTSREIPYYVVFRDSPATISPPPNGISAVAASFFGPSNVTAVLVPNYSLAKIPSLFGQTDEYIVNATGLWQTWYRQFAPPSSCTTDWCRERYYRALTNIAFNLYREYPTTISSWRDLAGAARWAMSPGAGYYGVWIWDSFFVAWMAVNNCLATPCVDTFMDSLRILVAHQQPDGQYPRQVQYATWDVSGPGTWQAPGGWSFAVDQADRKFGTAQWCTEFYDSLTRFHNYVRTKDSDADSRFEWGGTNSGWDGSIRWDFGEPNEALDLNAWMILDAESLRNCAQRIRPTDVPLWTDRLALYKTGFRGLCVNDVCYDRARTGSALSTIRTNAMYFGLLADAVTASEAAAMAQELYNTSTFGPNAANTSMLPTVSRSDPGFTADDTRCWSGSLWLNTNLIAYLGLRRHNLSTDAESLRQNTMATLEQGGFGYEHYDSNTFGGGVACFTGSMYAWTDATYAIMAANMTFDFTPVSACTDGETTPCTLGNDTGLKTCTTGAWGPCIVCTVGANRSCGTTGNQTCVAPGNWSACVECIPEWLVGNWSPCAGGVAERTCVDNSSCQPPPPPPVGCSAITCECTNENVQDCTMNATGATGNQTCVNLTWDACIANSSCATDLDQDTYFSDPACPQGTRDCNDNDAAIHPGAAETCNNVDDDCDGQVDESLSQTVTCGVGRCQNSAMQTCAAGLWSPVCQPTPPIAEVCINGQDDDCDGTADEGCVCDSATEPPRTCGVGRCVGQSTCQGTVWSACSGPSPITEACNNVDDDCDGQTDEQVQRPCTIVWNEGVQDCIGGTFDNSPCFVPGFTTHACENYTCTLRVDGIYFDAPGCQAAPSCQCSPDWGYSAWSAYDHGTCGVRTRVRTDRNDCPNSTSPRTEYETITCPGTVCGNGLVEAGEVCDGTALNGHTCTTEDDRFADGTPGCITCSSFNLSACTLAPPKLTYYGCSSQGVCVANPDGQYISTTCNAACGPPPIIPYFYWLGGAFAAGFVLWLLLRRRP